MRGSIHWRWRIAEPAFDQSKRKRTDLFKEEEQDKTTHGKDIDA
jgi:hypothetical protein